MIKKLYFQIEYFLIFSRKNFFFILLGVLLGVLAYIFKDKLLSLNSLPFFNQKFIGVEGRFGHENLPPEITSQISLGLTQNAANSKPQASSLVKNISVENNNQDYIFQLNPDLAWHDKKAFTSQDINYQITGLTVSPIDKYTLKISTEESFAPLLSLISQPLFKKNLIGLGPYQIQKINYHYGTIKNLRLKPIDTGQPGITYRFYSSQNDLIAAFKLGEVDQIQVANIPADLSQSSKVTINQEIQTNQRYSAIFLNTSKLNSKQLRQSLAYATPKTKDKNERCIGPISPNSWAYNMSIKQYNPDPDRASQLFSEVDQPPASINLSVNHRSLLPIAEKIKQSWKDILNLEITLTIKNQIDRQDFDAVLAYGAIPTDPDQYAFWHSTQTNTNITRLADERIDKLLEQGRITFDPQERKKIYLDFQKHLLEECPAIFLAYPTLYTISRVK